MKKYALIIVLSLLMVLAGVSAAFANDEICHGELSEYDCLVSLKGMSPEELKDNGFSNADIRFIESIDFEKMAAEIKELTDDELIERGISPENIEVIRSSDDVDLILSVSLGNVTYSVSKELFYKSGSKTFLKTKTTWNWSTSPTLHFMDSVATYTSGDFVKSSTYGSIKYYELGGSGISTLNTFSHYTANAGKVSYSNFPMDQALPSSANPNIDKRYYAKIGTIYNEWYANGDITVTGIACRYGHSSISCTPSVSVGSTGLSISFTPSASITTGPEDYHLITR